MYSTVLVGLDGSKHSIWGAQIALAIARGLGAEILACHVYDTGIHRVRFHEMEPGLPTRYQGKESLHQLRNAHDSLISDGLQALSRGYMEHFVSEARGAGVTTSEVNVEGRNYVKILEAAHGRKTDLIVLGAHGIGACDDGLLGSTAARILRHAKCDVLIARRPLGDEGILVGIDGSEHSMAALHKGAIWGQTFKRPIHVAAAYDPGFHSDVFKTMAHALSEERQEEVGLTRQMNLHQGFIDGVLGNLYQSFLDRARKQTGRMGKKKSCALLRGKAYQAMIEYAGKIRADLLIVGRHGYHREKISEIGSNAEAIVRLGKTNILVVASDV
jgi:nucleotide-binding universal stress UspA family protein